MNERRQLLHASIPPRQRDLTLRLTAYSTAATAVFVLAPTVDAQIKNITTFSTDGGNSFTTTAPVDTGLSPTFAPFFVGTANGAVSLKIGRFEARHSGSMYYLGMHHTSVGIATNSNRWVAKLGASAVAGHAFNSGYYRQDFAAGGSGPFHASGANAQATGYIGFRNRLGAHTYYGWLRVKVTNDANGNPLEVTFVDKNGDGIYGAFGTVSSNIIAGETAGGGSPVPEPASVAAGLALMALGAGGVREMRRRRPSA